jgi:Chitin binding Peritrophin-A domain
MLKFASYRNDFSLDLVLALIILALVPAFTQEIDCTDEFFRASRREESCQRFFICMIGRRVDFFCDDGDIFNADILECVAGDSETCEFE